MLQLFNSVTVAKAATEICKRMGIFVCVPIELYLQKQAAGIFDPKTAVCQPLRLNNISFHNRKNSLLSQKLPNGYKMLPFQPRKF